MESVISRITPELLIEELNAKESDVGDCLEALATKNPLLLSAIFSADLVAGGREDSEKLRTRLALILAVLAVVHKAEEAMCKEAM